MDGMQPNLSANWLFSYSFCLTAVLRCRTKVEVGSSGGFGVHSKQGDC